MFVGGGPIHAFPCLLCTVPQRRDRGLLCFANASRIHSGIQWYRSDSAAHSCGERDGMWDDRPPTCGTSFAHAYPLAYRAVNHSRCFQCDLLEKRKNVIGIGCDFDCRVTHCHVFCWTCFHFFLLIVLFGTAIFTLVCILWCVIHPMVVYLLCKFPQDFLCHGFSVGYDFLCK